MTRIRNDQQWMRYAIALANRHVGLTAENPSVACVLVRNGQLVGTGITAAGGRPHAETEAIASAGDNARGATAYVTLEPCCHTGKTPPCVEALVQAGVARVVIACADPDPRVNGDGIAILQESGQIEVTTDVCADEAALPLRGFVSRITQRVPRVSLKLASTLDGKIATAAGESQWITGERARAYGHLLRSRHDAILTGSNTFLADKPALTCRLDGLEDRSPQPILLDRRKRCTPPAHWWHITDDVSPTVLLEQLAERGVNNLMIEAGAELSAAFLKDHLVDTLYWFGAPLTIGGDGLSALGALQHNLLAEIPRFTRHETLQLGADTLTILEK